MGAKWLAPAAQGGAREMKKTNKAMKMTFATKGFEAKIGKTMITRRPYAKVTVSEDMIYLGAAVSVGIPLAVAGAKQVGKMGSDGSSTYDNDFHSQN